MSDINNNNNQRRKRRSRWVIPTVIAAVIGFVVIQLVLLDETREQQITDEIEERTEVPESEREVDSSNQAFQSIDKYLVFVSENNPEDDSFLLGDYVSNALDHLGDALEELSASPEIQLNKATITQLKEQSNKIADAEEQEKATLVKTYFVMVAETIESLNIEDSPELQAELNTLQNMIDDIDTESVIENQDEAVSQFLEQTGIVLELIEGEV
ncbi:hypothetical protein WJR50_17300 [Catalinimonas sp. 4WD22]|uniref:hypothetical protein n=1 Tax=Catalinimonas locisalis TaxID=3133978 RepID=UPI003100B82E